MEQMVYSLEGWIAGVALILSIIAAAITLGFNAGRRVEAQTENEHDGATLRKEMDDFRKLMGEFRETMAEVKAEWRGILHRLGLLETEVEKLREWRHATANTEHAQVLRAALDKMKVDS